MKYPDTHFGHLSLNALPQEAFNGTLSTSWRFKVNETVACNEKVQKGLMANVRLRQFLITRKLLNTFTFICCFI
jgi:hypothetical protein